MSDILVQELRREMERQIHKRYLVEEELAKVKEENATLKKQLEWCQEKLIAANIPIEENKPKVSIKIK